MSNLERFVVLCLLLNVTLIKFIKTEEKIKSDNDSSISNTGEIKDFQSNFRNSCYTNKLLLRFYTLNEDAQNTMLLHIKKLYMHNSQLIKALRVAVFKFIKLSNGSIIIDYIDQEKNFTITQSENNSSNDTLKIFIPINSDIIVKPLNPYLFLKCFSSQCNLAFIQYNSSLWIQDHCFRKTPK